MTIDCDQFTGRMKEICQGTSGLSEEKRQAYLAIWSGVSLPPKAKLPGTELKKLISWFPVPKKTNCGSCSRMEAKMNAWGQDKCREKMPYILAKLRIAAKRRGLPFSERLVKLLVEKAING
jgi:hypothetical protein